MFEELLSEMREQLKQISEVLDKTEETYIAGRLRVGDDCMSYRKQLASLEEIQRRLVQAYNWRSKADA